MSVIDDFLAMLAAERGAARNTLDAYRRDLEQADEIVGGLARASREDLSVLPRAWTELAPATIARKISALRQFYGFMADEGLREELSDLGVRDASLRLSGGVNASGTLTAHALYPNSGARSLAGRVPTEGVNLGS